MFSQNGSIVCAFSGWRLTKVHKLNSLKSSYFLRLFNFMEHFVLIGLMAAIYAAVIYGVGMLTAVTIPVMHVFAPSMTGILMGPIVLFVVKTVRRFGVLTLLAGLGVALFTLTGMGSINCLIFVVIIGLIADVIIAKTGFKTLSIGIGHGLTQAAYFTGGAFPFLFFLERELAKWQEMGMSREEILEYVKYFTGTFAVIGIVSAIVFGIAGVYIGKLILKRHFKDME